MARNTVGGMRLLALIALLVLAGLLGLFVYAASRRATDERMGVEARRILAEAGPSILESLAPESEPDLFSTPDVFSDFVTKHSPKAREFPELAKAAIPVPLIPSDEAVTVATWPREQEGMHTILVPYDPSVDQVAVFIPVRTWSWSADFQVYMSRKYERNFSVTGIPLSWGEEVGDDRNGVEFFEIAEALWLAARMGDRESFEEAADSFGPSDRFYFNLYGTEFVLSGRQLAEMERLLREGTDWR